MIDDDDTQTYANDSATSSLINTGSTQPRSGFDPVDTRRNLIAKRVAAGADIPIGYRCSNLVELLDNYGKSEGRQREHIAHSNRHRERDVKKRGRERKYDRYGPLVKMAEADGWLLIRRPYRLPGAMSRKEWDRLSSKPVSRG